jgi:predicted RecB family nuclease
MPKTMDISSILEKCLTPSTPDHLTATLVAKYITSPFAIHCSKFAPEEEKDDLGKYQQLLFERGKAHEIQTVQEKYPEIAPITYETREDGFKLALESMAQGIEVMHSIPVFYLPDGLVGEVDVLERSKSEDSIFGKYHYTIKEIKLAKNIREGHVIQGAFYNYMLGKIQGVTPELFHIINRDGEEIAYQYSEYEELLLQAIEGSRKILAKEEHVTPTYDSCGFPWESYCNRLAEETNDISLVAGISLKTKHKFAEQGLRTVQDLASTDMEKLVKIKGIGDKTAVKYVNSAKAIASKKPIIKNVKSIVFPSCKVEIFLDLEGVDPATMGDEVVQVDYLIGALVRIGSEEKYHAFVAKDLDHEKEMLLEFLDFMKKQKDYVIYHYHHYEKTHLDKMMTKYGTDEKTRKMVFDHMIDVYKVATDSVAFPTYGNGLKPVAKYLGFTWRHKNVDATESIALYLDHVANPGESEGKLQLILDYNEDDCIATRVIKDWLETVRMDANSNL